MVDMRIGDVRLHHAGHDDVIRSDEIRCIVVKEDKIRKR